MTRMEKKFVNSQKHGQKNIAILEQVFKSIDVRKVRNVLEVGCGVGIVSNYLNEKYHWDVTGTDVDPEQIALAKQHHHETGALRFQVADGTTLGFGDGQFDLVLAFFVFHHIANWQQALEEIRRVLNTGGHFIFHDMAYAKFTVRLLRPLVKKHGIYTIDEIIQYLDERQFKTVYHIPGNSRIMRQHTVVFEKR